MKKTFALFLLILSIGLLTPALYADSCKIATYPIPLMVENADNGIFVELAREIAKRMGTELILEVLPPLQAIEGFDAGKFDGFFPALDVLLSKEVSKSSEIYIKKDFVFIKEGAAPVNSFDDFKNKKIGITEGYPYAKAITGNKSLQLVPAVSDEENIKKLLDGQIDLFIVEEKTGLAAIDKLKATGITYNSNKPISQQKVYFAFQNDAVGKEKARKVSEALKSMIADGTFTKIMSKTNQ